MPGNQLKPTTPQPLATAAELNLLKSDLKKFSKLCGALDDRHLLCNAEILAEWRETTKELPALRARWAAVDRPASAGFIAAEIAKLLIVFPNSSGTDPDLFAEIVADDVQACQPTYYNLATAASNYRRKYRFFGISDLIAELKSVERRTERLRHLFKQFPIAERLKEIEADLPCVRKTLMEQKRRRKVRKFLWNHLKAQGREGEYLLFEDYWPEGIS